MKLYVRANLELEHEGQTFRLHSGPEGLELAVPGLSAATNLLRIPDLQMWMQSAEQALQAVGQTVRVTYKGHTLITLGSGSWTFAALTQALGWLK